MALRSHARSLAPTGADEVASPPDSDSAATKVDPEKADRASAQALLRAGDLDAALDYIRLNPTPMMSENLNKFQSCVKSLARDVTAETALDLSGEYERCIVLDAALSGDSPSVYGRDLGKKLSQAFYLLGLGALSKEDPQKAYNIFPTCE